MFLSLLKNFWSQGVAAMMAAGLATMLLLAYKEHEMTKQAQEHQKAITDQISADTTKCNSDKKITKDTNDDYEKAIAVLNADLDALRMRGPSECRSIGKSSITNGSLDATTAATKLLIRDEINPDYLIDFAGRAEQTRIKLMSCQSFITKTWSLKSQ